MRLGAYACKLLPGTLASRIYGESGEQGALGSRIYGEEQGAQGELGGEQIIYERHRHRYEFNDAYRAECEKAGLKISGVNPETGLVEIIEIPSHPFFIGTQFHPEFKSTPEHPQPIFTAFIKAALKL